VNVALLLLGPAALHRNRWWLAVLGVGFVAAGAAVAVESHETVTLVALEGLGWILVANGLARIAFSLLSTGGAPSLLVLHGVALAVLGIALADYPCESGSAVPWLFGAALVVNGLYQASSALVIRYPGWRWLLASGIGHVFAAGLLLSRWRAAVSSVLPLALGAGVAVMGASLLRLVWRVSAYGGPRSAGGEAALRYFLDLHVARRFQSRYLAAPPRDPIPPAAAAGAHRDLLVHVWTPTTVAKVRERLSPVSRYVAAKDAKGKFTVGHAAMEMKPDVYISHCDGDPTAFDSQEQVWETLRSRDVPGVFLPSFEEEVACYMAPTATIRFRNFDERQLRSFWSLYRAVTDYNFTNRNCSVAVAMALEAALMGTLGARGRAPGLLALLTNKDVWIAHFIRLKAREMVWTPGMMLDYALALRRVVEAD
jgi:uncharacterized membrane protein HdeD (DUF308 family)